MNNLDQKIKEFSQTIRETKDYQAYKKAAEIYDNDKEAQKLLNDFQMAQQELAILREGNFTGQEEQKEKFDYLLGKVRDNGVINEWIDNRNKIEGLVGDLAVALSRDLDFPFTLPPKKGCGCSG